MAKLIVILGPTGSGKSSLAVKLALRLRSGLNKRNYKGVEIISADSRQVYKNMAIGSNAITKKEMLGIKHHLLEFVEPQKNFSAGQFQKLARQKIKEIHKKRRLPFLVGGTGFYIDAVAENKSLPKAKADKKLRQSLEKKTTQELLRSLKKIYPKKSQKIDKHNPRRLIRAIEIASSKIKNPESIISNPAKDKFDVLYIGVLKPQAKLKQDIAQRFIQWLEAGFLMEVEKLIKLGVSRKKFKEFGLHYWYAYLFLKKEIGFKDFWNKSLYSLWHYAKRQNTWFKKNKNIHWVKNVKQAGKIIKNFLKK